MAVAELLDEARAPAPGISPAAVECSTEANAGASLDMKACVVLRVAARAFVRKAT